MKISFSKHIFYTSNSLEHEEDLARVEVGELVPEPLVVAVPGLGRHGHAGLHVVGLQVGEGELVGEAVHGVQVQGADGVPVAVCSNINSVFLALEVVENQYLNITWHDCKILMYILNPVL